MTYAPIHLGTNTDHLVRKSPEEPASADNNKIMTKKILWRDQIQPKKLYWMKEEFT
jgi:hypothetical protein